MVKKLVLNCKFGNKISAVPFYVGESAKKSHPIQFQSQWLKKEYGGVIEEEVMKSLQNLKNISEKNRINFEELCEHVFKEVNASDEIFNERRKTLNKAKKIKNNE